METTTFACTLQQVRGVALNTPFDGYIIQTISTSRTVPYIMVRPLL